MNHVITKIGDCFILQTEGETNYWWWEVDSTGYKGTDEEFVNDENNSHLGCSCAYFNTPEEAIADYLEEEY